MAISVVSAIATVSSFSLTITIVSSIAAVLIIHASSFWTTFPFPVISRVNYVVLLVILLFLAFVIVIVDIVNRIIFRRPCLAMSQLRLYGFQQALEEFHWWPGLASKLFQFPVAREMLVNKEAQHLFCILQSALVFLCYANKLWHELLRQSVLLRKFRSLA